MRRIGRSEHITWNDVDAIAQALYGADVLVNTADKSVFCRYTDVNRDEILRSGAENTRVLHDAAAPPRV